MELEKIEKIIDILVYLRDKDDCRANDILDKHSINIKTLYRYLATWTDDHYIEKSGKNHAHGDFTVKSTQKLREFLQRISEKIQEE